MDESVSISDFCGAMDNEGDYKVRYASTKPKIEGLIIPNNIVVNFMGEIESTNKCIPEIRNKTLPPDTKDPTIQIEEIIVDLPLSRDNYEFNLLAEDNCIYLKQNQTDHNVEFFFSAKKNKYEINEKYKHNSTIIDDKTTSGPIKLKKIVKNGRINKKYIMLHGCISKNWDGAQFKMTYSYGYEDVLQKN